jgi:ELWxxDGT repeat protein
VSRTSFFNRFAVAAASVALALLSVAPPAALADEAPQLLRDINLAPASSDPGPTVDADGTAFTFGCAANGELSLWKSDGTTAGTSYLGAVGTCDDWSSAELVRWTATLGGKLFFLNRDGLWSSDGTTVGTEIVAWIPGHDLVVMGSLLYFLSDDGALYQSDGTWEGTRQLTDTQWADPGGMVSAGGKLFFAELTYGGLWMSDGTSGGTKRVSGAPITIDDITAVGTRVFFVGSNDYGVSRDLWTSDGTKADTHRVKDIDPTRPDKVSSLVAVGNTLFFRARDSSHGYELWKSNGTKAGTVMVKNIRAGSRASSPSGLINVNGRLFFSANDGRHGIQLWKSNGTSAGTVAVSSTVPAPIADYLPDAVEQVAVGSILYFGAVGPGGTELWKSDGTTAGTMRVEDINPTGDSSPSHLAAVGTRLFFSADDGSLGRELWVSDGTGLGTSLAADLNTATVAADIDVLVRVGSTVFFAANDGVHGRELWKTDGTPAGTQLVKDIAPGGANGLQSSWNWMPVSMGGRLYFAADDGIHGYRLWKSDGTPTGTKMISSVAPELLTVIGNKLVFVAGDGQSLWKSDGTAAGTKQFKTFEAPGQYSGISQLASAGSQAYFVLDVEVPDDWYGEEHFSLWRTNGTAQGTTQITDFGVDYSPTDLTVVGSQLYFICSGALWKSDGTSAGTVSLKQIPDTYDGPESLTAVGDKLFFANYTMHEQTPQLWVSDGTTPGTQLVRAFPPVFRYSPISYMTAVGDSLFFVADADNGPADLWRSDGTPDGTEQVYGWDELEPSALRVVGDYLYLGAFTYSTGEEPWCIDTTSMAQDVVADLNPGSASSQPWEFTQLGSNVLFVARDGMHGRELWSVPAGASAGGPRCSNGAA